MNLKSDNKYSGKQIMRAGEKLRDSNFESSHQEFDECMDILSYWRLEHESSLENAFAMIQREIKKVDENAIFAKRLKRYPSIVNKLRRFEKMNLKRMQDIGGCRAIVSNPKKLKKSVSQLRKRPEIREVEKQIRFKDYIKHPKEDGYRGYHLVGKFPDKNGVSKLIEIQLRTTLQHDWATSVEIVDLFTNQALKSNQGREDWKQFFIDVSKQFAIMESIHLFIDSSPQRQITSYQEKLQQESEKDDEILDSCIRIQEMCKKLKVIHDFEAFANSLKIADERIEEHAFDGYVLLVVDTRQALVSSTMFPRDCINEAEKEYITQEKRAASLDGVSVALVSSTAVGGIKEAYPNYFADSTEFLRYLILINSVGFKDEKGRFFGAIGNILKESGL